MTHVFHSLAEIPQGFGPSVAIMGNFDGVHLGHQQVLGKVIAEARTSGWKSVAITFDPHPDQFLRPEKADGLLTLIPERLRLLAATGIDAVLVLRFDDALACLTARECVQSILVEKLAVRSMHEGANFRFGHRAQAGIRELAEFGREFGFTLTIHEPVHAHGLAVSSTAIRQYVSAGAMRQARWMLGRPFAVRSTQARGRGIGTRLLVPTVNLAAYAGLLPAFGVYVTRLTIAGRCFEAITNVGNRPTFGEPSFAVESHLLNYEPVELTEETPLDLEFLLRLRPEMTWPTPEALKGQIMQDIARAQRFHRRAGIRGSHPSRNA